MISSKDLMKRTGISRATLNNYINLGILQRPDISSVNEGDSQIPRIGFFPDDAVEIVKSIQDMKSEGYSMKEIASYFQNMTKKSSAVDAEDRSAAHEKHIPDTNFSDIDAQLTDQSESTETSTTTTAIRGFQSAAPASLSVEFGISNLPGPAFMVNNNFELTWWNDESRNSFFNLDTVIDHEIEARNLFHLLLNREQAQHLVNFPQLLSITMSAAKKRLGRTGLAKVYPYLENDDVKVLSELYESTEAIGEREDISHQIFDINDGSGEKSYTLYIVFFREGVLFAFKPGDRDSSALIQLLSQRNHVIREIMKNRRPFLTNLVTMVADLQNSVQICAELPADEYFELINGIWQCAEFIFRKYNATHGKHVGDGMVYYFLPQPDSNYIVNAIQCSLELRTMMAEMTKEWQKRKNWPHQLRLNIGLNEGQEWFGTYHSGTHIEFTALGDTINHAARLSDFARNGSIWATKNMLSKIPRAIRRKLRYGITRETLDGENLFAPELYSRISALVDLSEGKNHKFHDISALPVAQITDLEI